nr:BNR repeat-containing protein [Actinomycetota bacterium]
PLSAALPDLDPGKVALGRLGLLPAPANNVANVNSLPFTQDPLVTDGDRQYAVWVSGPRRVPLLAWRDLPGRPWSQPVDLSAVPGSPFTAETKLDPHHSYALGVDAQGRVHVAGNNHNEPLRYAVSDSGDPTRWQAGEMVSADEERVTYPAFVSLPDGALLFFYRDGRAGHGDVYLNRLAPGGEGWERVGMLVAGRGSGESPYLNHVAVGGDGALHVSGCFRGKGGAAANRDVWHAMSDDGGTTWRGAAGESLDLPLTHETVPIVVPTPPHGSGLVNQMGAAVDAAGRPHVAYFHYDAAGATQVALVSYDGARWQSRDLARLTHRMETETPILDASVARPQIACTADGNVWALFRATHDGRRGRLSCIRCTPDLPLHELPLYEGDLGAWEPTLDSRALRERDELHLLLTPAPPYPVGAVGQIAPGWGERRIGVLSVRGAELTAVEVADALGP